MVAGVAPLPGECTGGCGVAKCPAVGVWAMVGTCCGVAVVGVCAVVGVVEAGWEDVKGAVFCGGNVTWWAGAGEGA